MPPEPTKQINCQTCQDIGWLSYDVPLDHVLFGKAYRCPDCKTLRAQQKREALKEHPHVTLNDLMADPAFPEIYKHFSFGGWDALPAQWRQGKEYVRHLAELFGNDTLIDEGREYWGLFFLGARGTGKTSLLTSALIQRASNGYRCLWRDWMSILRSIRDTYNGNSKRSEDDIIGELIRVPVLFIDDFGPPVLTGEVTPWEVKIAWEILNARYNNMMATLLSSNQSYARLQELYEPRLTERLNQLWKFVEMPEDGSNMRIAE